MLAKELSDLLNIFGKGGGREGNKKSQKRNATHYFSLPVQRCNVIHRRWMPKAKQNDQNEKEEPTRIVKYGDKGHHGNSN